MHEELLQAYRSTDYMVCLSATEWACIRVDQALPDVLQLQANARPWGFITAWNPRSKARASADNLAAQQELLALLQALPDITIFPAIGIGTGGWHEPSLFVIGPDQPTLDALGHRYQQHAYVYGQKNEPARLRILAP